MALTESQNASRQAWVPTGFTVLDRSGHRLVVLDRALAPVARVPAPSSDGGLGWAASADGVSGTRPRRHARGALAATSRRSIAAAAASIAGTGCR